MTTTLSNPAANRCPAWCTSHRVDDDGAVLHTRDVGAGGNWTILLYDHQLEDGSRGWGEVVVDCELDHFTDAADAREIAAELEQVAVILEGMTHESTVHDNHHSYGPFPDDKLADIIRRAQVRP